MHQLQCDNYKSNNAIATVHVPNQSMHLIIIWITIRALYAYRAKVEYLGKHHICMLSCQLSCTSVSTRQNHKILTYEQLHCQKPRCLLLHYVLFLSSISLSNSFPRPEMNFVSVYHSVISRYSLPIEQSTTEFWHRRVQLCRVDSCFIDFRFRVYSYHSNLLSCLLHDRIRR